MRWLARVAAAAVLLAGISVMAADAPNLIRGHGSSTPDFTGFGALVGLAFTLVGALNLLEERYGTGSPGVRWTAIAATATAALIFLRMIPSGYGGLSSWALMTAFGILLTGMVIRAGTKAKPAKT